MTKKHQNFIYVLDKNGNPLMPTERRKMIFRLLDQKKAKVIRREPFTIKLLIETSKYRQDINLGVDVGSGTVGFAAIGNGKCYYASEVILRNDISKKMTERAIHRKDRRKRKTRYRPVRFDNRGNSKREDRYSPTVKSKFDSHVKEIDFIKSILPVKNIIVETAKFDNRKITNPKVWGWQYHKGINYGYANSREHALVRDNYSCQACRKKKCKLEVHHICPRSRGGSDEVDNLITLCHGCHQNVHRGIIKLNKVGRKRKQKQIHASQTSIVCSRQAKRVETVVG